MVNSPLAARRRPTRARKPLSKAAPIKKKRATKRKQRPDTVGKLNVDAWNPRQIKDAALAGLGISMEEFGDLSAITYNVRTGELVAGHQRIKKLIDKHGGDLKIKRLDDERGLIATPDGSFPVRFVDWTKSKQHAANVAANAPTIQGEFTDDLQLLLGEIKEEDPDVFDGLMFDSLLISGTLGEDQDTGNVADDLQKKWATAIGQVWEIKRKTKTHRLACGDSNSAAAIQKLLATSKPFLVVTDPPSVAAVLERMKLAGFSCRKVVE